MDYGHEMTEKELKRLEKKIYKRYEKAYRETKQKADKYLAKFSEADAEKRKLVKAKLLSEADYIKWRESAILTGKHWEDMTDVLANDMVNADKMAMAMISDKIPDFYAMNANYGTYEIESGLGINTSWTLYDHSTVLNLMRENPEIMKPRLDIPRDKRWNRQRIHSAITQGVLQGDSIPDISKRLRAVTNMDCAAALRNARTYTTAAENKGRIDSYERALALGIELEKEWMSTPDGRTRDSHVDLDGERCPVDGTFTNGCRYPGDPMGDPAEVYNCRCTLVAAVKKRDYSNDGRFTRLPEGMTYDDWKEHKLKAGKNVYYRKIDGSKFANENFSSADVKRINQRFKELDSVYHARVKDVVPMLQDEQERYDLLKSNYMAKLKADNPRMRQSTIEKRANELLGARPTKDTIDHFEGANFNMATRRMAINNYSYSQKGGIKEDIESRQKRMDRWLKKRGTMEGYSRGNVGASNEATFIHEYGHAIDATYKVAEDERFLAFYNQFTKEEISSKVSEYASTNEREFIAECFLDSFMGDTQTETSKQFMGILKEIIG